jgi:rSAM/selenodomain-associated transferase 1
MRPVVIVMVKAPIAGLAKTRLSPPLSEVDAASLASCFAQDVVNSALRVVPNLIVAFSPNNGHALLEALLPPDLRWLEQRGVDLGERLDAAIAYAANLGCGPIIVIGADSPTVPDSFIETARDALTAEKTDAVLGPTVDGGYYLLGLRNCVPRLFQNIDWSTPLTYEQTASNITRLGLQLLELQQWYDVDTFSDLLRLREELLSDDKARRRAPATYRWLLDHDLP